jgi:phage major head subunit gpT-like protein
MKPITAAVLQAAQTGFNATFQRGFETVTPSWMMIAMLLPSTTKTETYGWMRDLPGMREWVGQRVVNNLESEGAQLTNKDWEHTIGVDRNDIEDDALGIYSLMFSQQGEIVARHPDDLVWAQLALGFAAKGFDGKTFFSATHVGYDRKGKETAYSNLQGGAGAPWILADLSRSFFKPLIFQERKKAEFVALNNPSDANVFMDRQFLFGADARYVTGFGFHQLAFGSKDALDAANFEAAQLAMETQRRPDGSPLPVKATHLITGPSNRAAARTLLEKEYLAGGENNPHYQAVELHISPWLE